MDNDIICLTVSDDQLKIFPKFIEKVEEHRWGAHQGAFKVRVDGSSKSETPLSTLLYYMNSQLQAPQQEHFTRGKSTEVYYGFKVTECDDDELKKRFYENLTTPGSYTKETCCSKILKQEGLEALLSHYCTTINALSMKPHGKSMEYTKEDVNAIIMQGKKVKEAYLTSISGDLRENIPSLQPTSRYDCVHCNCNTCCDCEVCVHEREGEMMEDGDRDLSATSKKPDPILHAEELQHDKLIKATANFSLSHLRTILDLLVVKHDKVTCPSLSCGTQHSTFACNIQEGSLWSINFLHYGHSKIWFVIPAKYVGLFDFYAGQAKLNLNITSCRNLVGHKYVLITTEFLKKRGIPFSVIIQHPGDFVVLYPNTVHFGFNIGPNVAEATHFATVSWIPLGLAAPKCCCGDDPWSHMDLTPILAAFRPDLLQGYLNGTIFIEPKDHPFAVCFPESRREASSPVTQINYSSNPLEYEGNESLCEITVPDGHITEEKDNKMTYRPPEEEMDTKKSCIVQEGKPKILQKAERLLLQCPACDKAYHGGKGRLARLLNHAESKHTENRDKVLAIINAKYARTSPKQEKKNKCTICHKSLAGSATHLKLHLKTVHKFKLS